MGQSFLYEHLRAALLLFAGMAGPPLLAALVVGLIVGILQAATQIQDQTLPLTFKIVTVLAVLAIGATAFFRPLIDYTERVLTDFPVLAR